jgi:hypothetical protein
VGSLEVIKTRLFNQLSIMKKALLRLLQPSLVAAFCLGLAMPAFAGDPIPGVDVKLTAANGKTIIVKTDAEGTFSFNNLSEGTYSLSISHEQCRHAINTKGTGTAGRESSAPSVSEKFSLVCDDGNGIAVAAADVDGDGMADRTASHEIQSPRDVASGLPTGKRMHKPFTITKEWGASTPMLSVTVAGGKKEFKGHVTLLK